MARARHSSGFGNFSKKNKSITNDWSSPGSRAEEKATNNSRSSVLTQVIGDDENYGGL